jgi:hypothetical protein
MPSYPTSRHCAKSTGKLCPNNARQRRLELRRKLEKKCQDARLKSKTENLQHKQKSALRKQSQIREHIFQLAGFTLEEEMDISLLQYLPKSVMGTH